jgi:hypothetical protein
MNISNILSYEDQVKEDEMGEACSTHGRDEKCIHKSVGKPERNRQDMDVKIILE